MKFRAIKAIADSMKTESDVMCVSAINAALFRPDLTAVSFTVWGTPRPQGSMRAFYKAGMKYPAVTSDNKKLKPWRQQISETALSLHVEPFGAHVPLEITLNFFFSRPKAASVKKRPGMTTRPDADKLTRAVFDSLKGILIHDDSQIVEFHCRKHYGGPERVEIVVQEAIV